MSANIKKYTRVEKLRIYMQTHGWQESPVVLQDYQYSYCRIWECRYVRLGITFGMSDAEIDAAISAVAQLEGRPYKEVKADVEKVEDCPPYVSLK